MSNDTLYYLERLGTLTNEAKKVAKKLQKLSEEVTDKSNEIQELRIRYWAILDELKEYIEELVE